MNIKYGNRGFTLIELILVAAIIGLLASATLTVLNPFSQFQKAADARRKSDLAQIQKALESYYADNGSYPTYNSGCGYKIYDKTLLCINWGGNWGQYMNIVPQDPSGGHNYVYYSPLGGQSYYLYANLSRGVLDPQICQGLVSGECASIQKNSIPANSCGAACNFGVTSPDKSP